LVPHTVITLRTERLILRPLRSADAPLLAAMAGDPRVANKLADIGLPFDAAAARRWLKPTWILKPFSAAGSGVTGAPVTVTTAWT